MTSIVIRFEVRAEFDPQHLNERLQKMLAERWEGFHLANTAKRFQKDEQARYTYFYAERKGDEYIEMSTLGQIQAAFVVAIWDYLGEICPGEIVDIWTKEYKDVRFLRVQDYAIYQEARKRLNRSPASVVRVAHDLTSPRPSILEFRIWEEFDAAPGRKKIAQALQAAGHGDVRVFSNRDGELAEYHGFTHFFVICPCLIDHDSYELIALAVCAIWDAYREIPAEERENDYCCVRIKAGRKIKDSEWLWPYIFEEVSRPPVSL